MTKRYEKKLKRLVWGFTLVEVLLATLMMVLILSAAATAEISYNSTADVIKHTMQANNLAEETFAIIRSMRDQNVFNSPTDISLPACPAASGRICFPSDPPGYRINDRQNPASFSGGSETVTIDNTPFTATIYFRETTYRHVQIDISWPERGKTTNYDYYTIIQDLARKP